MPRNYAWQDSAVAAYQLHNFPTPTRGITTPDELFIVNAHPGAGKTRSTLRMAEHDLSSGDTERLLICSPTNEICNQWQEAACEHFNIELLHNVNWKSYDILPKYKGIVINYAALPYNVSWLKHYCHYYDVTLVLDEIHYLGEDLSWGMSARDAFGHVRKKIGLTGTLWRTDDMDIPWVENDGTGYPKAQIKYRYSDAIRDEINRYVSFETVDGYQEWEMYSRRWGSQLSQAKTKTEMESALRTALMIPSWEEGLVNDSLSRCWVYKMLKQATDRLHDLRSQPEFANSAALFVAMNINHAKQIRDLLIQFFHIDAEIVHSADGDARKRLGDFKRSDRKALVSVDMVTEGVDIPRLRVLGWATNKSTELKIRQILGRILRPERDEGDLNAYCFWPEVEPYKSTGKDIEKDIEKAKKEKEEKKPPTTITGPKVERNFKPIASHGEKGKTYYHGNAYVPAQMDYAAKYKAEHATALPWLKKFTVEEVAHYLQHSNDAAFMDLAPKTDDEEEIDDSGFGTFTVEELLGVTSSSRRKPLENKIKEKSNRCHEKAQEITAEILKTKCGDFKTLCTAIHREWAIQPGNHWQTDPMITEEELDRKMIWLEEKLRSVINAN